MTHHVQFPPYLPRGKIDRKAHPVKLPSGLCSGRQFQGLNTMCSQPYSAFCIKLCLGMAMLLSRTILS